MIEQILLIIGAAIFGILGMLHLYYTFFTDKFTTRDRKVAEAMKGTSPLLTNRTSVWDAWMGFNGSHSLGAMAIAIFYILLAVLIGSSYLFLAIKYWFRIPVIGILIATICFVISAILIYT